MMKNLTISVNCFFKLYRIKYSKYIWVSEWVYVCLCTYLHLYDVSAFSTDEIDQPKFNRKINRKHKQNSCLSLIRIAYTTPFEFPICEKRRGDKTSNMLHMPNSNLSNQIEKIWWIFVLLFFFAPFTMESLVNFLSSMHLAYKLMKFLRKFYLYKANSLKQFLCLNSTDE